MKSRRIASVFAILAMLASLIICVSFLAGAIDPGPGEDFHPQISSFEPISKGVKVSWSSVEDASKYILYLKSGDDWTELTTTGATQFEHINLTNNTKYTYTLRAFDENETEIGTQSESGFVNTYYDAPILKTAKAVYGGMHINWNKVSGIDQYRVYRKTSSGWKTLGSSNTNSFVDTTAVSGKSYTYTVRCLNNNSTMSWYDETGISGNYVAAPVIKISNVDGGSKISWEKVAGASIYRVFIKDGDSWKKLADTSDTSYIHKGLASNHSYTYTVRAMDKEKNFVSGYNADGVTNRYFTAPVLSDVKNSYGGIKLTWKAVTGAPGYRVYRKTAGNSWEIVKDFTKSLSFIDKNVKTATAYKYTVRIVSADNKKTLSSFDAKGLILTYYPAPEITSTSNQDKGVTIYFNKVSGVSKYNVYVADNNKWVKIATTTDNNVYYSNVKSGVYYTYTVRGISSDASEYMTGYNSNGFTAAFYKAPVISSITAASNGYTVKWKAVADAPMYRLYRKTFGTKWEKVANTADLTYTDTKADKSQLTAYTLRCISKDGKTLSSYVESDTYYCKGALANGNYTINGAKYNFKNGKICQGFVKVDGKTYYYDANGNVQKDIVVGNKTDGYYYAGKDGVITYKFTGIAKNDKGYWYCKDSKVDFSYRNAVTYNSQDWIVEEGKARKVSTEKDKTYFRAFKEIAKCTNSSMTKAEKLKAAFVYVQGAYTEKNPRVPHYHGEGWVELYANDMFVRRSGNCCSYGAAFAYMAKAIGYTNVYACNSGGHGWAEVDGKVYDPEWGRHKKDKSYFGLDYNTCKDPAYKAAIAPGYWWMHVKV